MRRNSISTRLAIVLVLVVTLTAVAASALIFTRLNSVLIESASTELERDTEVQATKFVSRIDELTRDTLLLANTPPIQGIIRASRDGRDPLDGSTLQSWRERLEIIFEGVARHKPDYLQVRFIGVADGGRELVRVNRNLKTGAVSAVAQDQLQTKGSEPYFVSALARKPDQLYLSPINLNREFGVIEQPFVPVVRSATPIYDQSTGEIFGIVVINLALERALRELTSSGDVRRNYYVTNRDGHYLVHPDPARAFEFAYAQAQPAQADFPLLKTLMHSSGQSLSKVDRQRQQVISARRVRLGPASSGKNVYAIVSDDFNDITLVSRAVLKQAALLILALAAAALFIGSVLARKIVRPIEKLAESVGNLDVNNAALQIPPSLPAEAGDLASALQTSLAAVRDRNDKLQAKNQELEQFAYIASHDLQEPVRTISSFSKLLHTRYTDQLDERGQKSLTFILDSCQRMQALIHGLLEYSRLGKQAEPEMIDIADMLQGVIADLNTAIENSKATLDIGPLPTLRIFAVEVRLLFQNLIGNALKFSRPGIPPQIAVTARREHGSWQFAVTDNGLGIEPQAREKVFMIFQRLQNRNEYEGTGIGLAHCRKIVEMHGGRIWIEDGIDGGSRFVFTLQELSAIPGHKEAH